MNGQSTDIKQQQINALKQSFPEVLVEGKIDFDKLKHILGESVEADIERYGLSWAGKSGCFMEIQTPTTKTLQPQPEQSVDFDVSQNMFIEGDNLDVLKVLQKSYYKKVKMIYIDPPYNTGNDFIYFDKFKENQDDYLKASGERDEDGNARKTFRKNSKESGHYHSNWMNMMYPRLFLAKNLLREDGVIFVSIDDNEVHNLRLIMNEIFGEENFVTQFIWNNEGNIDNQSKVKINHEYILCYSKQIDLFEKPTVIDPNIEETSKLYNSRIENSITKNGPANPPSKVTLPIGFPSISETLHIDSQCNKFPFIHTPIIANEFQLTHEAIVESGWSSKNLLDLYIKNGCEPIFDSEGKETTFAVTDTGAIYVYKKRSSNQGHVLSVLRNFGTTKQNSGMLEKWGLDFSYPKPSFLIQYLIKIVTRQNDIILDFFAGSGTTAQAVMELNQEDGGHRKFILVQLPEVVAEDSEAHKAGYATIADISRERIRRVIAKLKKNNVTIPSAHNAVIPSVVEGSIDDAEKISQQARNDNAENVLNTLNFKSFLLTPSNFKIWRGNDIRDEETLLARIEDSIDNIKPESKKYNMLYELLIKQGIEPTAPVEDKGDYSIIGDVIVCFAEPMTQEIITHIIGEKPHITLFVDRSFHGNPQLKTNASLQMHDNKIEFKVI